MPEPVPTPDDLLLVEGDPLTFEDFPLEVTPLFMTLSAIYQGIGKRINYPVVLASGQLMRGLQYLGFEAELIPACMNVFRIDRVRPNERSASDRAITDTHLVVWSPSLNRCIDLGVCQNATLVHALADGGISAFPVTLPVSGGRDQLFSGQTFVIARHPFGIMWKFFPGWDSQFDSLLARYTAAIEHGGLALAHVVVDLLSALAVYRDLHQLDDLYPRLGGLLSGRVSLPKLDDSLFPTKLSDEQRGNVGRP